MPVNSLLAHSWLAADLPAATAWLDVVAGSLQRLSTSSRPCWQPISVPCLGSTEQVAIGPTSPPSEAACASLPDHQRASRHQKLEFENEVMEDAFDISHSVESVLSSTLKLACYGFCLLT